MLTRIHRFHGHNALRPAYQKGSSAYGKNLKLIWLPSRAGAYRAAVVVSKKVHKSAVVRNRIRRRIFELLRNTVPSDAGFELVAVVQNSAVATMAAPELEAEVMGLLKKVPDML